MSETINWDKQRPEVGDHEPEDLVALSDYGWHLDIHDDLVLCPSQEAALRMQSWWDRANAAEAERDRLAANAEARERLLTRRTDALRAAERRVAELEAAAAPDWRPGVPSVEDVRAHEARGGLWFWRLQMDNLPLTDTISVKGGALYPRFDPPTGEIWFCPLRFDGTPAPWPVHASDDGPADGGDCEGVADAE